MFKQAILILFMASSCFAQADMDSMQFEKSVADLEKCIVKTGKKHALYSYNIANISTPGFEPILYPEDKKELYKMVPQDSEFFKKALLEHMTTAMARNRLSHSMCLALYKKKFDIYRQVATLGKK